MKLQEQERERLEQEQQRMRAEIEGLRTPTIDDEDEFLMDTQATNFSPDRANINDDQLGERQAKHCAQEDAAEPAEDDNDKQVCPSNEKKNS